MARKWRCKADPELMMRDHGRGFVDVVLEVPDDTPFEIAYASIPSGRQRGHWIICTDGSVSDGYSDPIDTKAEVIEQLDILAAETRPRAEASERYWRETWPKTHEAMKSGPGCSCFTSVEHQQAS